MWTMWWPITLVLLAAAGQGRGEEGNPLKGWLTPEQAEKLVEKLAERKPFMESDEARVGKQTLGLFFGQRDYQVLRGNPVLGYWDAQGFKWSGMRIAWDGVVSKGNRCKPITRKAWDAAMGYVARKHGLVIDAAAPLRMRGACVWAIIDTSPKEPFRGVVMEMRLESPSGSFRWRYSRGNPTIEGAVGASIELPVLMGQKINQPGWPRDGW